MNFKARSDLWIAEERARWEGACLGAVAAGRPELVTVLRGVGHPKRDGSLTIGFRTYQRAADKILRALAAG